MQLVIMFAHLEQSATIELVKKRHKTLQTSCRMQCYNILA